MIALLQRVSAARVVVEEVEVGAIGHGVLALIGVEREDSEATADRLLERILGYRIFADEAGRMNRSLRDVAGGLLLVPQFTLAADTRKGTRPGFSPAAPPRRGLQLFDHLLQRAWEHHPEVQSGRFGAHMSVTLTNDGPVTFWLRSR